MSTLTMRRGQLFGISRETWRMWKANAGNAKARRRWRRRDIPNSQRRQATAHVARAIQALCTYRGVD